MRQSFLPFFLPSIGEQEISEVVDTLRSDWITTGPKVERFEQQFADYVNSPAALAVNSCTAALHLALLALRIGPGDAVITTPMTFCSGIHVIEHVGARPILVDVEPGTLNIDPNKVREAAERAARDPEKNGRAKAILPVHLYGHPSEMDTLIEIARDHQLAIIEDAAHSLPAKYRGRMIGSQEGSKGVSILTCFSFYATKNLTTGEGGMLTGPPVLVDDARLWSLHGMSRDAWKRYSRKGSWDYTVVCPGFKYNMTDIQAAVGLHQLRRLPAFHARRREIVHRYNTAFGRLEAFETPGESSDVQHAWHLYVLRLNLRHLHIPRDKFIEELTARNIGTSVHFIPVHVHSYYRDRYGFKPRDFPVASEEFERIISLPLYPKMSDQDVEDVIEAVLSIAEKYKVNRPLSRAADCEP